MTCLPLAFPAVRSLLRLCCIVLGLALVADRPAWPQEQPAKVLAYEYVHKLAATLAEKPFAEDDGEMPEFLRTLNYDQYRDIRFRPTRALWYDEKLPFHAQFAHRGFLFNKRVQINVIDQGGIKRVPYSSDLFDYGKNTVPGPLPADLGFAGFRLIFRLNKVDHYDEVAVFLGSSYFRAVGKDQTYGISARGLAIDTGLPKPEEFPFFKEFWIEKPAPDATSITLYALLDSQRATGAYRFVITPGEATTVDVKGHVFMREAVEKLGIAPLTSMYLCGEASPRCPDDFRPEIHDSDGLMVAGGGGEWLWRPLVNPKKLFISAFQDLNPRGFGLMQRDRDYEHYQDLEAIYQNRPSLWVEPRGGWDKGTIELIEIPTNSEHYDNIVAFWVPEEPVKAGQQFDFEYRLSFLADLSGRPPGGRTLASRSAKGEIEGVSRRFIVDFGGGNLAQIPAEAPVEAVINTSAGKVSNTVVQKNVFTGGWRVFFDLSADTDNPIDLRCFLRMGNDVLTETWSFKWSAK